MMSVILRKSSSSSARALSSALALVSVAQQRCQFSAFSLIDPRNGTSLTSPLSVNSPKQETRQFHVRSGALSFKATLAPQAQTAVDDNGYEEEEGLEIAKLGISQEIVSALAKKNIAKLFPIQKAVLEPAMQGRDMFGRARTGTGKTLAFGIPILDRIILYNKKNGRGRNPMALVMAPTRELARQVEKEFRETAPGIDSMCVYGGTPIGKQIRELDYGVDVVVGTPGRIIDLMKRGSLVLSEIQFVVLDEADMMLGVGFVDDIESIFQQLPQNRQTMLFSATMPSWIKNLVRNYLKNPLTIDIVGDSDRKLADGITLYSIVSDTYSKASILGPLIAEHAKGGKCIVFTETKREADRLSNALGKSYKCEALHGDISQVMRERTLAGFRDGNFNILVATDVAARGLDVPNVDLVIHFALPRCPETFVHRSGRTGRAGKKGTAILIYSQDDHRQVKIFEREVGCRFTELPRITVEGGKIDMSDDMGGGRFGSFGGGRERRYGDSGFGRSGSQGSYGSGRFGASRTPGFGRSEGQSGSSRFGYNKSQSGGFGESDRLNRSSFGDFGSGGQSSTFGDSGSGRSSSFGDFGSGRSSGFGQSDRLNRSSFGDFGSGGQSSTFGDSGSGRSSSFGDFGSGRSSGFGSFGDSKNDDVSTRRRS